MTEISRRHRFSTGKALKWARVAVAVAMTFAMTLLFAGAGSALALKMQWVASIQIVPLALSASVPVIGFWMMVTLMFGRIYCSAVCPLGVMQDVAARSYRLGHHRSQRHVYSYSRPLNTMRIGMLSIVVVTVMLGFPLVLTLVDPYSAFGRMFGNLLRPVVDAALSREVITGSAVAVAVAALTLVVVAWISARHGRTICNTVCPVGSTLGLFSRFSIFHIEIDPDLCIHCNKCVHVCKSSCVNMGDYTVDTSRCVACFNCVEGCPVDAIRYTANRKKLSIPMMQRVGERAAQPSASLEGVGAMKEARKIDRRTFLMTGVLVAAGGAVESVSAAVNRVKAIEGGGKPLEPSRHVTPPGPVSRREFMDRCTGCGLCVSACPGHVLKASGTEYGLRYALHPVMDFEAGYCLYNCNTCTRLCPTGALLPLSREKKHDYVCGKARVETDNCIGCGQCVRRCPREVLQMTRTDGGRRVAHVADASRCIGCGACEYICPAIPFKAIVVDG